MSARRVICWGRKGVLSILTSFHSSALVLGAEKFVTTEELVKSSDWMKGKMRLDHPRRQGKHFTRELCKDTFSLDTFESDIVDFVRTLSDVCTFPWGSALDSYIDAPESTSTRSVEVTDAGPFGERTSCSWTTAKLEARPVEAWADWPDSFSCRAFFVLLLAWSSLVIASTSIFSSIWSPKVERRAITVNETSSCVCWKRRWRLNAVLISRFSRSWDNYAPVSGRSVLF